MILCFLSVAFYYKLLVTGYAAGKGKFVSALLRFAASTMAGLHALNEAPQVRWTDGAYRWR
jgi:hypothetical protein